MFLVYFVIASLIFYNIYTVVKELNSWTKYFATVVNCDFVKNYLDA